MIDPATKVRLLRSLNAAHDEATALPLNERTVELIDAIDSAIAATYAAAGELLQ